MLRIYTFGHSNHDWETFAAILRGRYRICHLIDVRTRPVSKWPQYNRAALEEGVGRLFCDYSHAPELGGQPCQPPEIVIPRFRELTEISGPSRSTVLMCSEGDPRKCHRAFHLAPIIRELTKPAIELVHIGRDGDPVSFDLDELLSERAEEEQRRQEREQRRQERERAAAEPRPRGRPRKGHDERQRGLF